MKVSSEKVEPCAPHDLLDCVEDFLQWSPVSHRVHPPLAPEVFEMGHIRVT